MSEEVKTGANKEGKHTTENQHLKRYMAVAPILASVAAGLISLQDMLSSWPLAVVILGILGGTLAAVTTSLNKYFDVRGKVKASENNKLAADAMAASGK